jgi:hypothetical protein
MKTRYVKPNALVFPFNCSVKKVVRDGSIRSLIYSASLLVNCYYLGKDASLSSTAIQVTLEKIVLAVVVLARIEFAAFAEMKKFAQSLSSLR